MCAKSCDQIRLSSRPGGAAGMSKYGACCAFRGLHELELVTQPRAMLQICRAEDGHAFEVRMLRPDIRNGSLTIVQVDTTIWDIER